MGYISTLYTRGESTITARIPEFTESEILERELFAAEAKARGFEITDNRVPNVYKIVNQYLKDHDKTIGWWFHVKETSDPNTIEFSEVGESGKAYDLADELDDLLKFLNENELDLNVRIFREGEDSGDVTRYIIEDSQLVSVDDAELRFPDGKDIE